MSAVDWEYVERFVAESDPDRYVATFFAPAARRRELLALYAFDHEVARIGVTAREPMAGHIRLAWWREQIEAAYTDAPVQAPVARALAHVVRARTLPRDLFERYLDARALDLDEAPFHDESGMEAHAHAVAGVVMRLAARIMGADRRADEAADLAGIVVAYAGHVHDIALYAARRRCRLPVQWLAEAGINTEDVFSAGAVSSALRRVLDRVGSGARAALIHLNRARFPRAVTPVLSVASLARRAIAPGFDPMTASAMPSWQRVARLSLANLTWRF